MDPVQFERMRPDECFAKGVERTRTNVAEHDTNRTRSQFGNRNIALRRTMGLHRVAGRFRALGWFCRH